jgi:hypothetical protein
MSDMALISFTENLKRHLPVPPVRAEGATVRELLEQVFDQNPPLRSYLVDDQGRLRKHVNVFVNSRAVADRINLSDCVGEDDDVFVFQALSGG